MAGSGSTQNISAEGSRTEIYGLEISTNYSIEVAAVNSVGVGKYSDPIIVLTQCKFCFIQTDILFFHVIAVIIHVKVVEATNNTIKVEWSVIEEAYNSLQNSKYEISYKNTDNTDCFNISNTIPIDSDDMGGKCTIKCLQEGTNYSITVSLLRDNVVTHTTTVLSATAETGSSLFKIMS